MQRANKFQACRLRTELKTLIGLQPPCLGSGLIFGAKQLFETNAEFSAMLVLEKARRLFIIIRRLWLRLLMEGEGDIYCGSRLRVAVISLLIAPSRIRV